MDSDLSEHEIEAILGTHQLGQRLIYLSSTSSTNDVAHRLARQGAPDGTVVVADEQEQGRGRLGRRWMAPPGTCLLCSILFRPSGLPAGLAPQLMMLCALAAVDAIRHLSGLLAAPKWPNDLVVRGVDASSGPVWRKLAGLLAETGVTGTQLEYAIIGIGINVNVAPEELPRLAVDATSILAETGRRTGRAQLVAELLARVERRYEQFLAGVSPFAEWAAHLTPLGELVQALTPAGPLVGLAEGVDEDGALRLRTPDKCVHRLLATDVTLAWRPATGMEGCL